MNKKIFSLVIVFTLFFNNAVYAQSGKYPDYAHEFLGYDRWEKVNRKVFNFNQNLNKYAIRPVHILWSSLIPAYGMDRIYGVSNNIEFPIRFVSSIIQRDFQNAKNESIRFITNTVLGLGGMFDPAKHLFKLEQSQENMEQALACCKCKPGPYFVAPVLSFTDIRGLFGKLFDTALNPSSYIGSPLLAMIKAGLTINRTSYIQPLLTMVESNYADPYEIMKKAFGLDRFIKCNNLDRIRVLETLKVQVKEKPQSYQISSADDIKPPAPPVQKKKRFNMNVESEIITPDTFYVETGIEDIVSEEELKADIKLVGYNPQNPVVDSMRTALFNIPEVDKSIWNELSLWNRSFGKRIKTDSVNITDGRDNYKFRYILQKNKQNSPLAIIYPSIGEGIMSTHSVLFAKLLYDSGYSVIIQGSHFQWEFVKSMPEDYCPGLPAMDALALREVSAKIISELQKKYNCEFGDKIFVGTSFGALTSLFVAAQEAENNTLGNTKYISICPPPNLVYAMQQVDKNAEDWKNLSDNFKQKVALTSAKVVKLYQSKGDIKFEVNNIPFDEDEGKLITSFIMHQKLSDLVFTLENAPKNKNCDIYDIINDMNYQDYVKNYLLSKNQEVESITEQSGLSAISNYLKNSDNYRIYHSLNDYLSNTQELKKLKQNAGEKLIIVDNGAHLGFLYRQEFINHFKKNIELN